MKSPLLRILVVDDDEAIHKQLRIIMNLPPPVEVELAEAKTIAEAEAAIAASKPSAILLDLNLSEDWKWERTLAMIEPLSEMADAPVIAFSGLAPDDMWPKAVGTYGAYNFFAKDEYMKPGFRGQLLRDITNAIFQHRFRKTHAST